MTDGCRFIVSFWWFFFPKGNFRALRLTVALLITVALISQATAVEPDEMLADPHLEARARAISSGLRCLVCLGGTIDDSPAPLARDLRLLVRERLEMGDSDEEIVDFIVARYGDYVLLRPRFSLKTAALWLSPLLILLPVLYIVFSLTRRKNS